MTIVYSRIQATDANYMEKITKELDEDNKGIEFDFNMNNNDDNIINVEYSGKLIALVEKQGAEYIIERVSGTPQPSEPTQSEEHNGEQLEEHKDKKEGTSQSKTINMDIEEETQKTHTGTGGDVIRLSPKKDNIIRVNFG